MWLLLSEDVYQICYLSRKKDHAEGSKFAAENEREIGTLAGKAVARLLQPGEESRAFPQLSRTRFLTSAEDQIELLRQAKIFSGLPLGPMHEGCCGERLCIGFT